VPPFPIDPETDTIRDVVNRWAEVQPDAPAFLGSGGEVLSYGELSALIDAIRVSLIQQGFGEKRCIALLHSGGMDLASIILGVSSVTTTVPVNLSIGAREFESQCDLSGVDAILSEHGMEGVLADAIRESGLPVGELAIAHTTAQLRQVTEGQISPRGPVQAPPQPGDNAFIFPTSGTTAQGKLVPLTHKRLIWGNLAISDRLNLSPQDRFLHIRPLHYANGLNAIFPPLISGGSVIFGRPGTTEETLALLKVNAPTWVNAPPTFFSNLVSTQPKKNDADGFPSLRFATLSSSKADIAMLVKAEKRLGCPLVEGYGAAEAHWVSLNPIDPEKARKGSVGLPLNEVRIRSPEGDFLPAEARGEVVVKGPLVFDGYINDPQANADAFVDGWFRTGDEGFLDIDGYLTLTGRYKEIINRGGEKVSPAEVDAALESHPDVVEATTFPIPHPTLGEEVAAAVVSRPEACPTDEALTGYLLSRLAGFKVPRRYVFVDEIPKSEMGKVQRHTFAAKLGFDGGFEPVRGPDSDRDPSALEAQLGDIWKRILKLDHIGLNDNFFLLGGDSLMAVEMFLDIERALRRRLPPACLFEAGTVAELAKSIEQGEEPGCMAPIQPHGAHPPFFCVHASGGGAVGFYNLAKYLGPDQPFYGFQSVGWDGKVVPFTNYRDMAAHYVDALRKIQPHGPYYLGGLSFGGRVAVYMANHLKAAGEEIGLLVLLDTYNLSGHRWMTLGMWLQRSGVPKGWKRIRETARYLWFRARRTRRYVYGKIKGFVLYSMWEYHRKTGKPLPLFLRRPQDANRMMRLGREEKLTFDGTITYFKADFRPGANLHPDAYDSWKEVVQGKLNIVPIPGHHSQIIHEPYVRVVAAKLRDALDEARSQRSNDQNHQDL
jgi:acyl-CoA synthetase (AMP-forming)/AMP-acid ligase II/thioesterase domain-containing protein/acyl carrier protein